MQWLTFARAFFSCACATFKLRWINCFAIHTRFYVFVRKLLSFILLWNSKWAAYDSRIRNSSHRITAIIIIIASWHCFVTFYFTSIIASILIHETCLKIALNGNWFEGNSLGVICKWRLELISKSKARRRVWEPLLQKKLNRRESTA